MTTQSNNTIRIATFPSLEVEKNPYLKLFYQGLKPHGIEVVGHAHLNRPWLKENRDDVDLIHFHWNWGFSHLPFLGFANQLPRFVGKLLLAKRMGYKLVWTVHDFFTHCRRQLALQYLLNLGVAQLSDGVFVNFHKSVEDVHRWFRRKRGVYYIPHGNYRSWYPNTVSREEAREALDLPTDGFVYLLFGGTRVNRGLDLAVSAFQQITGPDSRDTYMLIVGTTWGGFEGIEEALQRQIGPYCNIRRIREFVPDDQVQVYFNAADVVVLPYNYIYTSGAAMLALTFSRPIIAPRMGSLPEIIHDERIGILFEPRNVQSLAAALKAMRKRSGRNDTQYLEQECAPYDWELIWPQAAKAYHEIIQR